MPAGSFLPGGIRRRYEGLYGDRLILKTRFKEKKMNTFLLLSWLAVIVVSYRASVFLLKKMELL